MIQDSPTTPPRDRAFGRPFRLATFMAGLLIGGALVACAAESLLAFTGAPRASLALDLPALRTFQQRVANVTTRSSVALVGDSMLVSDPGRRALPETIQRALTVSGVEHIEICPVFIVGWSAAAQYFIADEIVRDRPDAVVLEVNFRAMGPEPLGPFGNTELAGWIHLSRLPEAATLPLSFAGITLSEMLTNKLIVSVGAADIWHIVQDRQARLLHVLEPLDAYLDSVTGGTALVRRKFSLAAARYTRQLVIGKARENRERSLVTLGSALAGLTPDNPRLRVLRALIDRFREGGVPVLVWIAPTNTQHLRSLGIETDGLQRSADAIRTVATEAGAGFADFHALLPDTFFRDWGDHPTLDGVPSGMDFLALRLSRVIARTVDVADGPRLTREVRSKADAVQ